VIYLWLKALHAAAALIFVGGVLATALSMRLLANDAAPAQAAMRIRSWNRSITTPAMLAVWGLGLVLASSGKWWPFGWLQTKLLFVLLLSALHGMQSGALRRIAAGSATTARALRVAEPLTIGAAILIAILAITKPF
jgi:protoporphyrinogen IX oxidase